MDPVYLSDFLCMLLTQLAFHLPAACLQLNASLVSVLCTRAATYCFKRSFRLQLQTQS